MPAGIPVCYLEHIHAWEDFAQNGTGLKAYLKAFFTGALVGLTRNPTPLVSFMREREDYDRAIQSTWRKVELIAVRHKVRLPVQ